MVPIFSRPPISERPFEPRDKISYPWLQSADESSSSAVRSSARERLLCCGLWAARPGLAAAGDTHAGTEALGAPVDPKGGKSVRAKSVERGAEGRGPKRGVPREGVGTGGSSAGVPLARGWTGG